VIDAHHRLFQIEKSFRMSKHDLQARPIYHHKRDSIEAHLTIVFAALAIGRFIEDRTGWSIKKSVRTTRRYRTVEIRAGQQLLTAEDPCPPTYTTPSHASPDPDLRTNLAQVRSQREVDVVTQWPLSPTLPRFSARFRRGVHRTPPHDLRCGGIPLRVTS
jgi:hypothetical protein